MHTVSVILTSYNHADYIAQAIQSVLEQTFADLELIIVDDYSSDNSFEIIKQFKDTRIRAFRNDSQQRPPYIDNHAIQHLVQGKYIAIHHSDDVWEPTKLEKQVAFLDDQPQYGAVFYNEAIDERANRFRVSRIFMPKYLISPTVRAMNGCVSFFTRAMRSAISVLIRKACYDTVGLYEYGYGQLCDFNMWVRLCMHYEIFVLPGLVKFRVRSAEANTSGVQADVSKRSVFEFVEIYQKYSQIENFEEFVKVFPEAGCYYSPEGFDSSFVFAMICLQEKTQRLHKLLGCKLLFSLLRDSSGRSRLRRFTTSIIKI